MSGKQQTLVADHDAEPKILEPEELEELDPDFDYEEWEKLDQWDKMEISSILYISPGRKTTVARHQFLSYTKNLVNGHMSASKSYNAQANSCEDTMLACYKKSRFFKYSNALPNLFGHKTYEAEAKKSLEGLRKVGGITKKRKYNESDENKAKRIAKLKATQQRKKMEEQKKKEAEDKDEDTNSDHDVDRDENKEETAGGRGDTEEGEVQEGEEAETDCSFCKKPLGSEEPISTCGILDINDEPCGCVSHDRCSDLGAQKYFKLTREQFEILHDRQKLPEETTHPCLLCYQELFTMKKCVMNCIDKKKCTFRCLVCLMPVHYSKSCSEHSKDGYTCLNCVATKQKENKGSPRKGKGKNSHGKSKK